MPSSPGCDRTSQLSEVTKAQNRAYRRTVSDQRIYLDREHLVTPLENRTVTRRQAVA